MLLKRLMLAIKRKEINTLFIQEFVTWHRLGSRKKKRHC
jgi:hypothetical protein